MNNSKVNKYTPVYAVGIDVGGTNTLIAVSRGEGELIATLSVPTTPVQSEDSFDCLNAAFTQVLVQAGVAPSDIEAVGLATAGAITAEGNSTFMPNVDHDLEVYKGCLHKTFANASLAVLNDANAAALGDFTHGSMAAAGVKDGLLVTLGTGIGAGIISNGRLVFGKEGAAGEIGHITIDPVEGRPCNCGRTGCLERYASAGGLVLTAQEFYDASGGTNNLETLYPNGKAVFDAAHRGDPVATQAIDHFVGVLAFGLVQVSCALAPELIVLGGGLSGSAEVFLGKLQTHFHSSALAVNRHTPIVVSSLGNNAGVKGAIHFALTSQTRRTSLQQLRRDH